MRLYSDDLEPGGELPVRHTADGENVSPALAWSDPPSGTRELVLLLEEMDDQDEPFTWWVVYGIRPDLGELPGGLSHSGAAGGNEDSVEGRNSLGNAGYDGPRGTAGSASRYRFRLLALDAALELEPGLERRHLLEAARGHVLDEAVLEVHYLRPDDAGGGPPTPRG